MLKIDRVAQFAQVSLIYMKIWLKLLTLNIMKLKMYPNFLKEMALFHCCMQILEVFEPILMTRNFF